MKKLGYMKIWRKHIFFFRTRFYLSTKRNNQYDPCLPYTVDDTVLLQVVD